MKAAIELVEPSSSMLITLRKLVPEVDSMFLISTSVAWKDSSDLLALWYSDEAPSVLFRAWITLPVVLASNTTSLRDQPNPPDIMIHHRHVTTSDCDAEYFTHRDTTVQSLSLSLSLVLLRDLLSCRFCKASVQGCPIAEESCPLLVRKLRYVGGRGFCSESSC